MNSLNKEYSDTNGLMFGAMNTLNQIG